MIAQPGSRFAQPPCFLNYVGQVPHSEAQELVSVAALPYNPPMSTTIESQPESKPNNWIKGEVIELLSDDAELVRLINRTRDLTDDAFEDGIHNFGFRIALWYMRRAAFAGDIRRVKACEVYLKRCDVARERQRKPTPSADERSVSVTAELLQKPRQTPQAVDSANST